MREALDLNSMDFLNLLTAIHRRVGVNIPELDDPKRFTLDGAGRYLANKLRSSGPHMRAIGGSGGSLSLAGAFSAPPRDAWRTSIGD
jgi:hypothetical protein